MSETKKDFPIWMVVVAALGGGGAIGSGGTSFLNNTDKALTNRVENLEQTGSKLWQKKASKEYVDLKIQALCK